LNNTILANNTASIEGGAIRNVIGGTISFNNCTIISNSTGFYGGGFYNTGTVNLTNTIVAQNSGLSGYENFAGSYNGPANFNFIGGDPMLGPFINSAGIGYVNPLFGSPVIDAGSDTVTNLFTKDQRRLPRKSGRHVDIGACEFQAPLRTVLPFDSVENSLRAAVVYNPAGSVITLLPPSIGNSFTLTNGEIVLSNNVTIEGFASADGPIMIDGNNASRIFRIASGASVSLNRLVLANGNCGNDSGGAIHNSGNLTVSNCAVSSNVSSYNGGGAVNFGTMTVSGSTFSSNTSASAYYEGGGIDNYGSLTISQSTFTGNAANGGGAIFTEGGSLLAVSQSTIVGNTAYCCGGGISLYASSGNQTLVNSIVAGNSASGNSFH